MTENEISRIIGDAAIEAHRELGGPGLLEDVYEEALSVVNGLSEDVDFNAKMPRRGGANWLHEAIP